jgi:serine/threonine-protein kinase
VALKIIAPSQFADEDAADRFMAETNAAIELDHHGIVPIFDVGKNDGHYFVSMALVEGDSLEIRITDNPLSPIMAAELIRKISEAVRHSHEKGVTHGNLRPASILLDYEDQPQITSFGSAQRDHNLATAEQIPRTLSFLAPEQVAGHHDQVDESADVYGLGALLYSAITGRAPFEADSPAEMYAKILESEPELASVVNPEVPSDLAKICTQCLKKNKHRRYASVRELGLDLQRFLNNRPVHGRPTKIVEHVEDVCRSKPIAAAAVVAVAIVSLMSVTLGVVWNL